MRRDRDRYRNIDLAIIAIILWVIFMLAGCKSLDYKTTWSDPPVTEIHYRNFGSDITLGKAQMTKNHDGTITITVENYTTDQLVQQNTGKLIDFLTTQATIAKGAAK